MNENASGTPQAPLTPATVSATIKKARKESTGKWVSRSDGKQDGLVLRISPKGHASWSVEFSRPGTMVLRDGKPRLARGRVTIGDADGSEALTLADAREDASEIRARARAGDDPALDKKRELAEAARREAEAQKVKVGTVEELAQQWLDAPPSTRKKKKAWRPASRASIESLLRKHILPAIGKIPAGELTDADVTALLHRVHDQTPVGSNRVFEVVRSMFNWARRQRKLVTTSPCVEVEKLEDEREHQRERTFTNDELRAIVRVFKGTELGDLVQLIMRTGTRSHEARAARWALIDFDRHLWTIPAEDAKSGRKHEVPLSAGAWKIIEARWDDPKRDETFVFPGATSACTVCKAKGHMGAPLNRRMRALSIKGAFLKNVGTDEKPEWEGEPVRLHDLRRTAADRMWNELGIAPHVVDFGVLAHAPSKLIATYMPKGPGRQDVEAALDAWDSHLDGILSGESKRKASVTAISARRRA
jgi:integrase